MSGGMAFDEAQLDDGSRWYTVDIGDALPWGEGATEAAALDDLADSIRSLWSALRDEPDERLAPHLRQQRDFLNRLFRSDREAEADAKDPEAVERFRAALG